MNLTEFFTLLIYSRQLFDLFTNSMGTSEHSFKKLCEQIFSIPVIKFRENRPESNPNYL